MKCRATPLICVVALLVGSSLATASTAQRPVLDRAFLIQAITDTHAMMKYAELAESRAASDKVKAFARKLMKEHQAMLEGMDRFASNQKLAVVAGFDSVTRAEVDRLSKLEGSVFDREFVQRIALDHSRAIKMFEAQVAGGGDAKLRAFAAEALPQLRGHLREAMMFII